MMKTRSNKPNRPRRRLCADAERSGAGGRIRPNQPNRTGGRKNAPPDALGVSGGIPHSISFSPASPQKSPSLDGLAGALRPVPDIPLPPAVRYETSTTAAAVPAVPPLPDNDRRANFIRAFGGGGSPSPASALSAFSRPFGARFTCRGNSHRGGIQGAKPR